MGDTLDEMLFEDQSFPSSASELPVSDADNPESWERPGCIPDMASFTNTNVTKSQTSAYGDPYASECIRLVSEAEVSAPENWDSLPPSTVQHFSRPVPASHKAILEPRSVICHVESIFEDTVDALLAERDEISIDLRPLVITDGLATSTDQSSKNVPACVRTLCFPGKSEGDAWRFSPSSNMMNGY